MKKRDIILLANLGVTNITNHDLEPANAYKVVKFRKAINSNFESISKEVEAIRKDVGIEDGKAFDDELLELRAVRNRSEEQAKRLDEMEATLKRFSDLLEELNNEDVDLGIKAMPYDVWHKLQDENKDKELGGTKRDLLSGYVEDILEGVLWAAPADN